MVESVRTVKEASAPIRDAVQRGDMTLGDAVACKGLDPETARAAVETVKQQDSKVHSVAAAARNLRLQADRDGIREANEQKRADAEALAHVNSVR